jgi:4,5-DOPA dioxygenase extradiol
MKQKMPVLFIGHGSPMNALADNPYSQSLVALAKKIPIPRAILCISAHWMTEGSWVTRMAQPKTIHDFYGFPEKLFKVQYPAPGSLAIADEIIQTVQRPKIHPDNEMWGLDHGTWSVLRHMYPEANVPTLQLSLNLEQPAEYHFELGQELKALRENGILLVGSGNIVHNLRKILWEPQAPAYDWALEFDSWVKEKLDAGDHQALVRNALDTEAGRLSIPTAEHWLPLLYIVGAADKNEKLSYEYTGMENGAISMRSLSFGP